MDQGTSIQKSTYENSLKEQKNLFNLSKMKLKKSIIEHSGTVLCICILKDGRLASCSADEKIKIFNLQTYLCEITIDGHDYEVTSITVLENGYLLSCSFKIIEIWDIKEKSFQKIKTLIGHNDFVTKVIQLSNSRLGSFSKDNRIKIWKAEEPYECIETLKGNTGDVNALIELKNKSYIVSADGYFSDKSIRFWNNKTYICEKVIKQVYCCKNSSLIEMDSGHLIVGGYNKISIVNIITFQLETKCEFSNVGAVCSIIDLKDGSILCGCESQGKLLQVDLCFCKILYTKDDAHKESIRGLMFFGENQLISCSKDHSIKIWDC